MSEDGNIITIQLSEIEYLRTAHVQACEALGDAEAEIERLREALEKIVMRTAGETRFIAKAALVKEAGQ